MSKPDVQVAPEDRSAVLHEAAGVLRSMAAVLEGIRLAYKAGGDTDEAGSGALLAFEHQATAAANNVNAIARDLMQSQAVRKWNKGNAAAMASVRFTQHKERA